MNNKECQDETNEQQSTKDEGIMSCHTIGKPHVGSSFSFCFLSKDVLIDKCDSHTTIVYDGLSLVNVSNEKEGYSVSPALFLEALKQYFKEDFPFNK